MPLKMLISDYHLPKKLKGVTPFRTHPLQPLSRPLSRTPHFSNRSAAFGQKSLIFVDFLPLDEAIASGSHCEVIAYSH